MYYYFLPCETTSTSEPPNFILGGKFGKLPNPTNTGVHVHRFPRASGAEGRLEAGSAVSGRARAEHRVVGAK